MIKKGPLMLGVSLYLHRVNRRHQSIIDKLYIEYIPEIEIYILMGEEIYGRIQMRSDSVNRFISGKEQRI
jgi:hypothetical protein